MGIFQEISGAVHAQCHQIFLWGDFQGTFENTRQVTAVDADVGSDFTDLNIFFYVFIHVINGLLQIDAVWIVILFLGAESFMMDLDECGEDLQKSSLAL